MGEFSVVTYDGIEFEVPLAVERLGVYEYAFPPDWGNRPTEKSWAYARWMREQQLTHLRGAEETGG